MIAKRNILLALSVLVIVYLIGISTGHYKHFPFSLLFGFKEHFAPMPENKRNFDTSNLKERNLSIDTTTGIYLTYGQSNAANHGQIGYEVENEVFQYLDGKAYPYKDPSLGATGDDGSVWGMVGDKLIKNNVHKKVVFSNNGYGGRKIEDLNKEPYLNYLIKNYNQL